MVTLTLIQGVVNTFVVFLSRIVGFVVDRVLLRNERGTGPGYFLASFVAQILLGLVASMIAFGISGGRGGLGRLFMSHPPIEERIAALQHAGND